MGAQLKLGGSSLGSSTMLQVQHWASVVDNNFINFGAPCCIKILMPLSGVPLPFFSMHSILSFHGCVMLAKSSLTIISTTHFTVNTHVEVPTLNLIIQVVNTYHQSKRSRYCWFTKGSLVLFLGHSSIQLHSFLLQMA